MEEPLAQTWRFKPHSWFQRADWIQALPLCPSLPQACAWNQRPAGCWRLLHEFLEEESSQTCAAAFMIENQAIFARVRVKISSGIFGIKQFITTNLTLV